MANKKQIMNEGYDEQPTAGVSGKLESNPRPNAAGSSDISSRSAVGQSNRSAAGQPSQVQSGSSPSTSNQSGSAQAGSGQGSGGPRTGIATTSSTGGTGAGTAAARSLYDQAKETAGQAYDIAAEKATTKLEEQKTSLSGGLSTIAESVRKVGENLRGPDVQEGISKYTAEYSGKAAEKIEGVANYFEEKSVRDMYSDLENFARRNPLAFIGGAFALGLVTARFLKSGSPRRAAAAGAGFASENASESRPEAQSSSYR